MPNSTETLTPLQYAASAGDTGAIKQLLDSKADPEHVGTDGKTALYWAAEKGDADIVALLLDAGAKYEQIGARNWLDEPITALDVAAKVGSIQCVTLLLRHNHDPFSLLQALHTASANALIPGNKEDRAAFHTISESIKQVSGALYHSYYLNVDEVRPMTWDEAYIFLFNQPPGNEDKYPRTQDAAIRNAFASMHQLLQNPKACIPYISFLTKELERQWAFEHPGQPFPPFNTRNATFVSQCYLTWPIPNEQYQQVEKFKLLSRVILDKFQQYGMGSTQSKWAGYIPKLESKNLLLNNEFFVENRLTINGFFHGNMHNIQRFILLSALEEGVIPTYFLTADEQVCKLEFKHLFSALMRTDLLPSGKRHAPLWNNMLDSASYQRVTFSHPHRLHSLLMTDPVFAGVLRDYLCHSFCTKYTKLSALYNHAYGRNYNNLQFWEEIKKLRFHLFVGPAEFALQMDEKKDLDQVSTIDTITESDRDWGIQQKNYQPLSKRVGFFAQPAIKPVNITPNEKAILKK